jgi:hypothetical protein
MSHTEGLWMPHGQLILGPVRSHPNPRATEGHVIIGEVHWDWDGDRGCKETRIKWSEAQANQRLMCAAPELLAAGELVIERWCKGDLAEAVNLLDAAIEKARVG